MNRTKGRVIISKKPKENLELAEKIYAKHIELGEKSPLNLLEDFNWETTGKKIAPTLEHHILAEFHKGESEKNYLARDINLSEILIALKQSIALLKASYGGNPKKLTDWGINVDDSPKVKKIKVE